MVFSFGYVGGWSGASFRLAVFNVTFVRAVFASWFRD
jgi:hypothetical protein